MPLYVNKVSGLGSSSINKSNGWAWASSYSIDTLLIAHVAVHHIIGSGGSSTLLKNNLNAWCWGLNNSGSLGDNNTTNECTPVAVCNNHTFCKITAGAFEMPETHNHGIDNHGQIWSWGFNGVGSLGDLGGSNQSTPVAVWYKYAATFCQIAAGGHHGIALDNHGVLWYWGEGSSGQHGDGYAFDTNYADNGNAPPITFCKISCGGMFSMGINNRGALFCWGRNYDGNLGYNDTVDYSVPVPVYGNHTFCEISGNQGNEDFSMGIDNHGKLWAWGINSFGQLGNHSTINECTPIAVYGGHTFCKITAGKYHSLAIDYKRKIWAWGDNNSGKLGNNSVTNESTPVAIYNTNEFYVVGAGFEHTLAIDGNNHGWGWGWNYYGQLGDKDVISEMTPVRIYGL